MSPMLPPKPDPTWFERLLSVWATVPYGLKVGLVGLVVALLIWGVVKLLGKIGRSGRRNLLVFFTAVCFVGAVGFSTWSFTLPEPVGTYFVLWHQVVRVGAAVFTTLFIINAMGLGVPLALNRIENSSIVGFVAARHV